MIWTRVGAAVAMLLLLAGAFSCGGTDPNAMRLEIKFPSGQTYPDSTQKLVIQFQTGRAGNAAQNLPGATNEVSFSVPDSNQLLVEIVGSTLKSVQQGGSLLLLPPTKPGASASYERATVWLENKDAVILALGEIDKVLKFPSQQSVLLQRCTKNRPCEDKGDGEICDGKDNDGNGWIDDGDACAPIEVNQTISNFFLTNNAKSLLTLEEGNPRIYAMSPSGGLSKVTDFSMNRVSSSSMVAASEDTFFLVDEKTTYGLGSPGGGRWVSKEGSFSKISEVIQKKHLVAAGGNVERFLAHGVVANNAQVYSLSEVDKGKDKGVLLTRTLMVPANTSSLVLTSVRNGKTVTLFPTGGTIALRVHSHSSLVASLEKECQLSFKNKLIASLSNTQSVRAVATDSMFALLSRQDNAIYVVDINNCTWAPEWFNKVVNTLPQGAKLQDIAVLQRGSNESILLVLYSHDKKIKLTAFVFGDGDTIKTQSYTFDSNYAGSVRMQASVENKDTGLVIVQTDSRKLSLLRLSLVD